MEFSHRNLLPKDSKESSDLASQDNISTCKVGISTYPCLLVKWVMTYLECICQKLVLSDVKRSCFTTANALSSKNSHKNAILSQNSIKRESGLSIFLLGKLLLIGGVCRALGSRVSNFYYFLRRRSVVGCHCGNFPCHKGIHLPFLAINDWHFCLRSTVNQNKKPTLPAYSS